MKTILTVLAITTLLLGSAPARAGSAGTGRVSPGTLAPALSTTARLLVGKWRMAAFVANGRRVPLPGNYRYEVTIRADGTLSFNMGTRTPKPQTGTWKLKGNQLTLVYMRKPMKTTVQVTKAELVVAMPQKANMRMIFQRLAAKRP